MADANGLLDKLLAAANEASVRARAGWLTYLAFGTYLAVVIAGTTPTDLLLDNPAQLPLLGVSVPLYLFYVVAPLLFVALHLSLLLQLYVTAVKLKEWHGAASRSHQDSLEPKSGLDPFLFTRVMGGADSEPFIRFLMWRVVEFTVLVAPVLLLLSFQIRYLPQHSESMTLYLRLLVLADLGLLWLVWPRVLAPSESWPERFKGWSQRVRGAIGAAASTGLEVIWAGWRPPSPSSGSPPPRLLRALWAKVRSVDSDVTIGGAMLLSLGVVLFAFVIATVPGGLIERCVTFSARDCLAGDADGWNGTPLALTHAFFDGHPDPVKGTSTTPFSRSLLLSHEALSTWDEHHNRWTGPSLRGRDLRHAVFAHADLRGADLTAADLRGADLRHADLTDAKLGCAAPPLGTTPRIWRCANLAGAQLLRAKLTGADLRGANLTDANLRDATLTGANLRYANLSRAHLDGAILAGADLSSGTRLIGAYLTSATLTGADLSSAVLTAADLNSAKLIGTSLFRADLTGANLYGADLTGALLYVSTLTAADLRKTILPGADLRGARVHGALAPMDVAVGGLGTTDTRALHIKNADDKTDAAIVEAVRTAVQGRPDTDVIVQRVQTQLANARETDPHWATMAQRPWRGIQRDLLTQQMIGWACTGSAAAPIAHGLIARAAFESSLGAQDQNHEPVVFAQGVLACGHRVQGIELGRDDLETLELLWVGKF